jgi:rhodanese-related sulfurtransferase
MQQLLRNDTSLSKNERFVLVCATGRRSLASAQTLHERGFTEVVSLIGGLRGLLAHQH